MSTFHYTDTEDGSRSCLDAESGELYHNRAGAYLEALKNYAQPALSVLTGQQRMRILDVCFGLGYNSWVLVQEALKSEAPPAVIEIIAIDNDERVVSAIQDVLRQECFVDLNSSFEKSGEVIGANMADVGSPHMISLSHQDTRVSVQIVVRDLREQLHLLVTDADSFNVIFHDPFSPAKMPELWTIDIFQQYYALLASDGVVLTYSSAGCVRGGFTQAGFHVYRTEAVGGKFGGTAAAKSDQLTSKSLMSLTTAEQAKVRGIGGIPFRDETGTATRERLIERRRQEQSQFGKSINMLNAMQS